MTMNSRALKRSASEANLANLQRPVKRPHTIHNASPDSLAVRPLSNGVRKRPGSGFFSTWFTGASNALASFLSQRDEYEGMPPPPLPLSPNQRNSGSLTKSSSLSVPNRTKPRPVSMSVLPSNKSSPHSSDPTNDSERIISNGGSPVPLTPSTSTPAATPLAYSQGRLTSSRSLTDLGDMSQYKEEFSRSGGMIATVERTPDPGSNVSVSDFSRKRLVRVGPVGALKGGLSHRERLHIHSVKHEQSVRQKLAKDIFHLKKANGYTGDLNTLIGYLGFREHVEKLQSNRGERTAMRDSQRVPPMTLPPVPSSHYLQRALQVYQRSMAERPRPRPFTFASDKLAQLNKHLDADIEQRLRPSLPKALKPDQEEEVEAILRNPRFTSQAGKERVANVDVQRLKPEKWLNDEIINFYGAMIMERSEKAQSTPPPVVNGKATNGVGTNVNGRLTNGKGKGKAEPKIEYLKVHVFSTYFLQKLQESGYEKGRLNKWTKKFDIFSKDIILIPCNIGNSHWTCAAINFKMKRIEYYDSLGISRQSVLDDLRTYLDKEHRDKKKTPFNFDGWVDFFEPDSPQQENSYDCGVFLCQTMENLSRGLELPAFDFGQPNMSYLRKRMIWEIANSSLGDRYD